MGMFNNKDKDFEIVEKDNSIDVDVMVPEQIQQTVTAKVQKPQTETLKSLDSVVMVTNQNNGNGNGNMNVNNQDKPPQKLLRSQRNQEQQTSKKQFGVITNNKVRVVKRGAIGVMKNQQTTLRKINKSVKLDNLEQEVSKESLPFIQAPDPFIVFGNNQQEELKFQSLFSKILNFGMLSMFTDLTDQSSKISLLLVLKQVKQIAGKDLYKVVFKVENPKYATNQIYYGAEFAVNGGATEISANEVNFISFGKSVLLKNVFLLLSIMNKYTRNLVSLDFLNETKNSEGLDFNGQAKSSMVEFIQTILSLTNSQVSHQDTSQTQVILKGSEEENKNELIGSSNDKQGEFDLFDDED